MSVLIEDLKSVEEGLRIQRQHGDADCVLTARRQLEALRKAAKGVIASWEEGSVEDEMHSIERLEAVLAQPESEE